MKTKWKQEFLLIFGLWFLAVIVYFLFPMLPDWDWFNYRAFNCFSFLTDRFNTDFMPTNMRYCINPILDIPSYLAMFKLQNHPYIFIILSLWDSVLLIYLLIKICRFIFEKNPLAVIGTGFSLIYISLMPSFVLQHSFEQNDIKIAVITLLGIYIFIKYIFSDNSKNRNIFLFLSGAVVGIATGLKLTAFSVAIAFPFIILILFKKIDKPYFALLSYMTGMVVSFLIIDGYWLFKVYAKYDNPVFPYFNDIFKSEYADKIRLVDKDWGYNLIPNNFFDFVLYPFVVQGFSSDNFSSDLRNIINYISVVIVVPLSLIQLKKVNFDTTKMFANITTYDKLYLTILLFVLPCVFNLAIFANGRYVIANCTLSGIIVFSLLSAIFAKQKHPNTPIIICGIIILTINYFGTSYGAVSFLEKNLFEKLKTEKFTIYETDDQNFEDNSVVILANSGSSATVIQQNPNIQYVSLFYPKEIFDKYYDEIKDKDGTIDSYTFFSKYGENYCKEIISSNKNIYIVYAEDSYEDLFKEVLSKYGNREITDCRDMNVRIFGEKIPSYKCCQFNRK